MLTQEKLKSFLHYNPESGVFTHKYRPRDYFKMNRQYLNWNKRYGGKVAGSESKMGYTIISVDYIQYKAHRLAFLYMTGAFPSKYVDHVNHDKKDNRWCNLREVEHVDNMRNTKLQKNNKSGVSGVSWMKKEKLWRARIGIDDGKRRKSLGCFKDFNDAKDAVIKAREELGYHKNHA